MNTHSDYLDEFDKIAEPEPNWTADDIAKLCRSLTAGAKRHYARDNKYYVDYPDANGTVMIYKNETELLPVRMSPGWAYELLFSHIWNGSISNL